MHRNHLAICALAVAAGLALILFTGASPLSLGLGAAVLLCPLVMVTAMWLLMRTTRATAPAERSAADERA